MSQYNFKGGQFEITMADTMTAQLIAATPGPSLAYGQAQGSDMGMQALSFQQDRGIDGIGGR